MANVKLIKLLTGEEILAEIVDAPINIFDVENNLNIKNPIRIVLTQDGKVGLVKWAELSPDTEMKLDRFHIVTILTPHKQLIDQYLSIHSKIVPATISSLIMP